MIGPWIATWKTLLKNVDLAALGERLKQARLASGLTQGELACTDASIAYISRIESGQRRPEYELLRTLATRLGMSIDHFVLGSISDARTADRLQLDYAELALKSDDPRRAVELTTDLLDRYAMSPERDFIEQVRMAHAAALEVVGNLDAALDTLEAILADEECSPSTRVRAATSLSRCYRESGDLSRAIGRRVDAVSSYRPEARSHGRGAPAGCNGRRGILPTRRRHLHCSPLPASHSAGG